VYNIKKISISKTKGTRVYKVRVELMYVQMNEKV